MPYAICRIIDRTQGERLDPRISREQIVLFQRPRTSKAKSVTAYFIASLQDTARCTLDWCGLDRAGAVIPCTKWKIGSGARPSSL